MSRTALLRRLRPVLPVLLALLALAGCRVDVRTSVDLAADGSGTVTVTAEADPELVTRVPSLAADLRLDDARQAGWTVQGPVPTPAGGLSVTASKPFRSLAEAEQVLGELSGPAGPLTGLSIDQQREFGKLTSAFAAKGHVDGGLRAFSDDALVQAVGSVPLEKVLAGTPLGTVLGLELAVTLPGELTGHTGQAEGSTVRWTIPVDGTVADLQARSELRADAALSARRWERLAIAGIVGWLVAVLVGGTALLVRRRRRETETAPDDTSPDVIPNPGTPRP